MKTIIALLITTLISIGAGLGQGQQLTAFLKLNFTPAVAEHPIAAPAVVDVKPANLREMKPVITNLAAPPGAWIRLEVALLFQTPIGPNAEPVIAEVMNDMVAYLRTLNASQLEGASGLRQLRDDLSERASLRTDRKVSDVLIQTLVVQ